MTYRLLTDDEKKYIWKHKYELSARQISDILGLNYGTVKNYMTKNRIKGKQKEKCGRYLREPGKRGPIGNPITGYKI